jgi:hypothetical protein
VPAVGKNYMAWGSEGRYHDILFQLEGNRHDCIIRFENVQFVITQNYMQKRQSSYKLVGIVQNFSLHE